MFHINLFSSLGFFIDSVGFSALLIALNKLIRLEHVYRYFILIMSIWISILFYGSSILQPVVFLAIAALALQMHRRKLLSKPLSSSFTLLPLILVKTTSLSFISMIGISFATFRAIDVLMFASESDKIDPIEYVAYLFFPLTILAGPMYRWQTFRADIAIGHQRICSEGFFNALEVLLLGVCQKFLLAEAIDRYVLAFVDPRDFSPVGIATNSFCYSAFLYFDFAGYSNMVVGIGKLFGLNIPANFNNPILARNPQDFWRRWHVSLSQWLRDVIFMPTYMHLCRTSYFSSRRLLAQNIAIFLTLFCMGTWNGLSLHYIVSGVMFGSYAVIFNIIVSGAKTSPLLAWVNHNRALRVTGSVLNVAAAMLALYVFSGRSPI